MGTIFLNCANCGAPIAVPEQAATVTCGHCRAKLGIKYPEPQPPEPQPAEQLPGERLPPRRADSSDAAKPHATTVMLDVVRAGVQAVDAGVTVVEKVSSFMFWTKVTAVFIAVIFVFGGCVIPAFLAFKLLGGRLIGSDEGVEVEQVDQSIDADEQTTADDRGNVKPPAAAELKPPAPRNLEKAREFLRQNDLAHRRSAVQWLAAAPVSVDANIRIAVAKELFEEIDDQQLHTAATVAFSRWLPEDAGPWLLQTAKTLSADRRLAGMALLRLFGERRDLDGLVALVNYPDESVREQAGAAARRLNATQQMLIQQCVTDLRSGQRWPVALSALKSLPLDAQSRSDVAASMDAVVEHNDRPSSHEDVADVLANCFPEGLPKAVELMERSSLRGVVAERLKKAGPIAETFVWHALEKDDRLLGLAACDVLAEVGTQRSIPHLKRLAEGSDEASRRAARSAISAIVAANRQPANP